MLVEWGFGESFLCIYILDIASCSSIFFISKVLVDGLSKFIFQHAFCVSSLLLVSLAIVIYISINYGLSNDRTHLCCGVHEWQVLVMIEIKVKLHAWAFIFQLQCLVLDFGGKQHGRSSSWKHTCSAKSLIFFEYGNLRKWRHIHAETILSCFACLNNAAIL